jgi:hypothetical protein
MGWRSKPPPSTPKPDITPAPQHPRLLGEGFPPPQHQTEGWKPKREPHKATRKELISALSRVYQMEYSDYNVDERRDLMVQIGEMLKRELQYD